MERAELVEIYRKAWEAANKYTRNCNKVYFMSLGPDRPFAFVEFEEQLQVMAKESKEAAYAFADAVKGLSTEEIVSIITEVTG